MHLVRGGQLRHTVRCSCRVRQRESRDSKTNGSLDGCFQRTLVNRLRLCVSIFCCNNRIAKVVFYNYSHTWNITKTRTTSEQRKTTHTVQTSIFKPKVVQKIYKNKTNKTRILAKRWHLPIGMSAHFCTYSTALVYCGKSKFHHFYLAQNLLKARCWTCFEQVCNKSQTSLRQDRFNGILT